MPVSPLKSKRCPIVDHGSWVVLVLVFHASGVYDGSEFRHVVSLTEIDQESEGSARRDVRFAANRNFEVHIYGDSVQRKENCVVPGAIVAIGNTIP
jgi:enhancing lycopene biosynthesis protein 2